MKRIITIITAIFAVTLIATAKSSEQKSMEKAVTQTLSKVSFAHFKEYDTITLQEEIDKWTKAANFYINWDESFVDAAGEMLNTPGLAVTKSELEAWGKDCRQRLNYHTALLNHLDKVKSTSNCNKVTFTIYQLTYVGLDKNGNTVHNHCYGRFNDKGEMVAFRLNDTADWEVTGDFWSIPEIYKNWNISEKWTKDIINVNF